jgi:ferredoxin
MKQFDERDTMFSRIGLIKGTRKYNDYYAMHPELQEIDDSVRKSSINMMAKIFGVEPANLKITQKIMAMLQKLMNVVSSLKLKKIQMDASDMPIMFASMTDDEIISNYNTISKPALITARAANNAAYKQKVSKHKVKNDSKKLTRIIKELALIYGADAVGIAKVAKQHHYSHRGDMYGMGVNYGKQINLSYQYAIVVASELNKEMINRAPESDVWKAAMLGNAKCATITAELALYIKSLGYEAQTDNFFEYYSPMTPLAAAAGIGQIGRCNCVISKKYGNRLKIGAVLTNLSLIEDGPIDFGIVEFCQVCLKCAHDCPAKAISFKEPELFNGILQWKHNDTKCMETWMQMETGCGICMASCPFSQGVDPDLIKELKGTKR